MGDFLDPIQVIIIAVIVVAAIFRAFYRIFLKPFIPDRTAPPAGPAPSRGRDLKVFLEELRRDLGHGDLPEPKTDGLLDEEEPAAKRPVDRAPAPAPRPAAPIHTAPAAPVPRPPAPRPRAAPVAERPSPRRAEAPVAALVAATARAAIHGGLRPREPAPEVAAASVEPPNQILGVDIEAAIILSEVLGPPRAFRGRRRMV